MYSIGTVCFFAKKYEQILVVIKFARFQTLLQAKVFFSHNITLTGCICMPQNIMVTQNHRFSSDLHH